MTGLSRREVEVTEMPLGQTPKMLQVAPIGIEVYESARRRLDAGQTRFEGVLHGTTRS
jgi:hypothetical protein